MFAEPFKTILGLFRSMAYVVEFQTGKNPTRPSDVDIKVPDAFERPVDDLPSPSSGPASPAESISSTNESIPSNEDSIRSSVTSLSNGEESFKPSIADVDVDGDAVADPTPDPPSTALDILPSPALGLVASTFDTDMLELPSALATGNELIPLKKPFEDLARRVLDLIRRYEHNTYARTGIQNAGEKFLPMIEQYIVKNERIKMVLPAFPCVSLYKSCLIHVS